ncbi:DNA invertase Pin-like site-specific DNA recombinase [Pseudarthrobacter defluvii]|uniref:recombinase family protein n=1 Tax=Pseudarthrobacter defluvii TaxID=410837 RepID=UPI002781EE7C|nr:recombinase family protein [Pseudarthrobacter defluvii]MDQ0769542.1 DNA invertase Pin-like site-specific DNA recombinase [Pseudarthrobacter defluvii]
MGLLLGYVRVSTTDQHGAAQRDALLEAGVEEKYIYFDQLSGAKAAKERPGLSALLAFAREGDTVIVYRIDRLGRSLIDVLNTVAEMQERGIGLRSLVDGIDPSTASGRLQLGLFATLAEYERELINERVRAEVMAAKARGVKFGQQPVDETTVEDKIETARRLLSEGKTADRAAKTVGWSRATLYRYLKMYGTEPPTPNETELAVGPGKSGYAKKKRVPARR